jgi:hypothetical protein
VGVGEAAGRCPACPRRRAWCRPCQSNPMRSTLIRLLAGSVIAALLMPIVLGVVLGLAALLAALGDASAAALCRRIGLVVGVAWLLSVIMTAVASGIVAIDAAARHELPGPAGSDQRPEGRM